MHIILPLLAAIVTILILLNRLADAGISLGGLNPFMRRRRRAWRDKVEANPLFSIHDSRDLAALLVVGVAKVDGDMSAEEKQAVLREFESTFKLRPREASELLGSSAYLLGDAKVLLTQLDDVMAKGKDKFGFNQIESTLAMMERIAGMTGGTTEQQRRLIEGVKARLTRKQVAQGTWA